MGPHQFEYEINIKNKKRGDECQEANIFTEHLQYYEKQQNARFFSQPLHAQRGIIQINKGKINEQVHRHFRKMCFDLHQLHNNFEQFRGGCRGLPLPPIQHSEMAHIKFSFLRNLLTRLSNLTGSRCEQNCRETLGWRIQFFLSRF